MDNLLNKCSRLANKATLKLKEASPAILLLVGTAGVVATVVLACKETMEAKDIFEEHREAMDEVHEKALDSKISEASTEIITYTDKQKQEDTVAVYKNTVVKVVKVYWPSVLLGAGSIGCIFLSSHITKNRYLTAMAALTQVNNEYQAYRAFVAKEIGEEKEVEIHHQAVKFVEEKTLGDELQDILDEYEGRLFTLTYSKDTTKKCSGELTYDEYVIRCADSTLNQTLKKKGYLTGLDIANELGIKIEHTSPLFAALSLYGVRYDDSRKAIHLKYCVDNVRNDLVNGGPYEIRIDIQGLDPVPLFHNK